MTFSDTEFALICRSVALTVPDIPTPEDPHAHDVDVINDEGFPLAHAMSSIGSVVWSIRVSSWGNAQSVK